MLSKFLKKSITKTSLMLTLILLSACATPPDACGWLRPIDPNPGFETRWTNDEKRQIDTYDKTLTKECGGNYEG